MPYEVHAVPGERPLVHDTDDVTAVDGRTAEDVAADIARIYNAAEAAGATVVGRHVLNAPTENGYDGRQTLYLVVRSPDARAAE